MTFYRELPFWKNYNKYKKISGDSSTRGFVDAILFWKLLLAFPKKNILEIGCSQGLTTGLFFDLLPDSSVTSIDPVDRLDIFRSDHEQHLSNYRFILDKSQKVTLDTTYDLILIDGDHSYCTCWQDIQNCWQHIDIDGIVAIDDYSMPGVAQAIDNLYNLHNDWVPFLQGIQTQFWHHRSQDKSQFLDDLLQDPIKHFILLENITDRQKNIVLQAKSIRMLTDNYEIFHKALEMYNI
jgi:predicted O-methyltransferase YrrM